MNKNNKELIKRRLSRISVILAMFLLSACATNRFIGNPETPYMPEKKPEVGDILHIPTGVYVTDEQMFQAATDMRVVYIGETHDNPAAHRLQLSVLEAMHKAHKGKTALGMEMFNHSQQEALDHWVKGDYSEKEFLKKSKWFSQWRMDFEYYKPLLHFAKNNRIPMIALNAEKKTVSLVARKKLADMTDKEKEGLPEMDMNDPYQNAMSKAIFSDHDNGGGNHSGGFKRVQTLWDEIMAESIANYLASPKGEGRRMVVIAGGNHVRFGFGIPRRAFRRLPLSYTLIGSNEIVIPDDKKEKMMDVDMPGFPMAPYDYIMFTEYESLDKKKVKLGVFMTDGKGQVIIEKVIPGTSADEAGFKPKDIIIRFDSEIIKDNFDLIYEINQMKPGETAVIEVNRDGERVKLDVTFREHVKKAHHGKHKP